MPPPPPPDSDDEIDFPLPVAPTAPSPSKEKDKEKDKEKEREKERDKDKDKDKSKATATTAATAATGGAGGSGQYSAADRRHTRSVTEAQLPKPNRDVQRAMASIGVADRKLQVTGQAAAGQTAQTTQQQQQQQTPQSQHLRGDGLSVDLRGRLRGFVKEKAEGDERISMSAWLKQQSMSDFGNVEKYAVGYFKQGSFVMKTQQQTYGNT